MEITKSVISLISLKSGDFIILVHQTVEALFWNLLQEIPMKSLHLTNIAFDWKNLILVSLAFDSSKNFPWNLLFFDTERYSIWLENLVFSTNSVSFDIKQEIPWNLLLLSFTEICSFYENIEIFIQVHQTVQLTWKITVSKHFLKKSLISLKSVHLFNFGNFQTSTTNGLKRLLFWFHAGNPLKSVHFGYFLRSADFTEICSVYENRQFSVKKLQTV